MLVSRFHGPINTSCYWHNKYCYMHGFLKTIKGNFQVKQLRQNYLLSSENGSVLKGKNFLNKYFLLEWTSFQKGIGVQECNQEVIKVVSLVKNEGKSTQCVSLPSSSRQKTHRLRKAHF